MENEKLPPNLQQEHLDVDDVVGIEPNILIASMSYLGFLVLVPLLTRRNDQFVLFHIKQGLVILAGYIIAILALAWVSVIGNLLWIAMFVASVAGLVTSLQGKRWKIPGIGTIADQFRI